jgi:hypothetical protein
MTCGKKNVIRKKRESAVPWVNRKAKNSAIPMIAGQDHQRDAVVRSALKCCHGSEK